MEVKVTGYANFSQVTAEYKRVQAELLKTQALQKAVWDAGSKGGIISPAGAQASAKANRAFQQTMDLALASSGAFRVEQMRLNSATDDYVKKLRKGKVTLKEYRNELKEVRKMAYAEQVAASRGVINGPGLGDVKSRRNMVSMATPIAATTKELGNLGNKLAWAGENWKSFGLQMVNQGKNAQWTGRQLSMGLTLPILAIGAAAGKAAFDLDKGLTQIVKVYNTTADQMSTKQEDQMAVQKELDKLRADSFKLVKTSAREYNQSMQDTLAVEAQLAAAGFKGNDLLKATSAAQRAALLGDLDQQQSVQATIALQTQLGLNVTKTADAWNLFNKVENETNTSMKDLTDALPTVGAVVKNSAEPLKDFVILLAATRSAGFTATRGANALKAAFGRFAQPTARAKKEFKSFTGEALEPLIARGDTMVEKFTLISDAIKDLDKTKKDKIITDLFGVNQLGVLSAVTDQMQNLGDATTNVGKAAQVAGMSTAQLAKTADTEVARQQAAISTKLSSQWKLLVANMAEIGRPFIMAVTEMLTKVNDLVDGFNGLPGKVKKSIFVMAGIVAVAGPLIMIYGLMKNLVGMSIRLAGSGMSTASNMKFLGKTLEIMTAEERAATLYAKFLQEQLAKLGLQATDTTLQIDALTQAIVTAHGAARASLYGAAGIANPSLANNVVSGRAGGAPAVGTPFVNGPARSGPPVIPPGARMLPIVAGPTAAELAAAKRLNDLERSKLQLRNAGNRALSVGLVALTASSVTQNKMVDQGAKLAFILAGVVPLIGASVNRMRTLVTTIKAARTAAIGLSVAEQIGGGVGLTGKGAALNSGGRLAAAAERGGGKAMLAKGALAASAITGVSAATLGVGAAVAVVGAGLYMWHKHAQKVKQDMLELQQRTRDAGDTWTRALTGVERKYKSISDLQYTASQGGPSPYQAGKDFAGTKEGKKYVSDYKTADDAMQKNFVTMSIYRNVLEATKGDTKKAQDALLSFFLAIGQGFIQASENAGHFSAMYGNMTGSVTDDNGKMVKDFSSLNQTLLESLLKGIDSAADPRKAARNYVKNFDDAFARANGGQGRREYIDNLIKSYTGGLEDELPAQVVAALQKAGITIQEFIDSQKGDLRGGRERAISLIYGQNANQFQTSAHPETVKKLGVLKDTTLSVDQLSKALNGLNVDNLQEFIDKWDYIMARLRKSMPTLSANVLNPKDLLNDPSIKLLTAGNQNQKNNAAYEYMFKTLMGDANWKASGGKVNMPATGFGATALNMFGGVPTAPKTNKEFAATLTKLAGSKKDALELLNAMRALVGLPPAKFLTDWMNKIPKAIKPIKDIDGKTVNVDIDISLPDVREKLVGIARDAQAAGRDAVIDLMTEQFQNQQAAQQRALQDRQQSQSDSLAARQEKRRDRITKSYDTRIKKINKEIDAETKAEQRRQRIFEAEQKRIERLKDLANSRIDINVALAKGQYDEAAKLQNDQDAMVSGWSVSDQADASSRTSAARNDRRQSQIDKLNDQKDARLKNLDKIERAEQRSLQKRQAQEERSLAARQAMQQRYFNMAIQELQSMTPRTQAEMQKNLNMIAAKYKIFSGVLKPIADSWGQLYGDAVASKGRAGLRALRDDAIWENVGHAIIKNMIWKPMGFDSLAQMKGFLQNGKWPAETSKAHHGGGMVGRAPDRRTGFSGTATNRREELIRAEKGEYIINRRAAAANLPLLQRINANMPVAGKAPRAEGRGNLPTPNGGAEQHRVDWPVPSARVFAEAMAKRTRGLINQKKRNVLGPQATGMHGVLGSLLLPEVTGGASPTGLTAMRTARSLLGQAQFYGNEVYQHCQQFVRMMLGAGAGFASAKSAWGGAKYRHPISSYSAVPPGVPVYWSSGQYGHVALSMGAGNAISTDYPVSGRIGSGTLAGLAQWKGGRPDGWTEDINGKKIWPAPLKRGGFVLQGGLARLHDDESVMTAGLTEDLKRGVQNFADGGSTVYNIDMTFNGVTDKDEIAEHVVKRIKREESRKPRASKVGSRS